MQINTPPSVPAQPQCEPPEGKSPTPGCGRNLKQLATMAFQLNQMSLSETDPAVKEAYRNALASLGELIAFS
jgi:hypothetical protein